MSEVKQALNELTIVGYLKSKNLKVIKKKENRVIRGSLTIEVNDGTKVHNHTVNVYSSKMTKNGSESKGYKGFVTIMNEYIAKDDISSDSELKADYVKVLGNVDYNVFKTRSGDVVENNRLRANFIHRISPDDEKQQAVLLTDVITDSYEPEIKDDEPTGYQLIKAFSAGYKGKGIKFKELKLKTNKDVGSVVPEGSTIRVTIKLNNYVIVTKAEKESEDLLFGEAKDEKVVEDHSYVNNYTILTCKMASEQYTDEDLKLIKSNIQEQIKEAEAKDVNKKSSKTKQSSGNLMDKFSEDEKAEDITADLPF